MLNVDTILVKDDFPGDRTMAVINDEWLGDPVNHPPHYKTKNGLETIDVIDAFTEGLEGTEAVCTGNILKYVCRWKKKNGVEDLKKAQWYLNHLISILEGAESE